MQSGLLNRVKRLESALRKSEKEWRPETDADWLMVFTKMGEEGFFAGEPDFPTALAAAREAVQAGRKYIADRGPNIFTSPLFWLFEMKMRVSKSKPPVTEAEFNELAEWFHAHEELWPDELIDIGGGRMVDCTDLREQLAEGPRALEVTELVEDLRRLRAMMGASGT